MKEEACAREFEVHCELQNVKVLCTRMYDLSASSTAATAARSCRSACADRGQRHASFLQVLFCR